MAIKQAHEKILFALFFSPVPLKSLDRSENFSWIKFRDILDICLNLPVPDCRMCVNMCERACACEPVHIFLISNISTLKLSPNLTFFWQPLCYCACVCACVRACVGVCVMEIFWSQHLRLFLKQFYAFQSRGFYWMWTASLGGDFCVKVRHYLNILASENSIGWKIPPPDEQS